MKNRWLYFIPLTIILPFAICQYKGDYGFEFFFVITLVPLMTGLKAWFRTSDKNK